MQLKVPTGYQTGSGRPYPKISVLIMACPLSHHFVTCQVMSTQKSLFSVVQPSTLIKSEKRKPESDTGEGSGGGGGGGGWYPGEEMHILS